MARTSNIAEQMTELLAIKLFEHDSHHGQQRDKVHGMNWKGLCVEDRNLYRDIARTVNTYDAVEEEDRLEQERTMR